MPSSSFDELSAYSTFLIKRNPTMLSTASIALIALLASPAFAAPLMVSEDRYANYRVAARTSGAAPVVEARLFGKTSSSSTSSGGTGTAILGSAAGGAASGLVSNLLSQVYLPCCPSFRERYC